MVIVKYCCKLSLNLGISVNVKVLSH